MPLYKHIFEKKKRTIKVYSKTNMDFLALSVIFRYVLKSVALFLHKEF